MAEATRHMERWLCALNKVARPYLTLLFATAFMAVCVIAWATDELPIESFMAAIGPIVSTLVGFWFGERAALKNPAAKSDEGEGEGK